MDQEMTLRFIAQEAKDGLAEVRAGVPNAVTFWLETIEKRALAALPCAVEIPGAGLCELTEGDHQVIAGRRMHRHGPVTWNGGEEPIILRTVIRHPHDSRSFELPDMRMRGRTAPSG